MLENCIQVKMIDNFSKEELFKKIKMTNEENSIIYTNALAKCIGLLFYIEESKKAFALHVPSSLSNDLNTDIKRLTDGVKEYIKEYNLINNKIKYIIIPGYNYDDKMKEFIEKLQDYYDNNLLFSRLEHNEYSAEADLINESVEFVFDAKKGKFVTGTYFLSDPYFLIDKEINYEITYHKGELQLPQGYKYDEEIFGTYYHDCIRFKKNELDFRQIKDNYLKRLFGGNSDYFKIKNNIINLTSKSIYNKYFNFEDGYYICKSDDFFEIVEKDKIKEYLDYRYIGDCINELYLNDKIKTKTRLFKIPIFKSIQLSHDNDNSKKIV